VSVAPHALLPMKAGDKKETSAETPLLDNHEKGKKRWCPIKEPTVWLNITYCSLCRLWNVDCSSVKTLDTNVDVADTGLRWWMSRVLSSRFDKQQVISGTVYLSSKQDALTPIWWSHSQNTSRRQSTQTKTYRHIHTQTSA